MFRLRFAIVTLGASVALVGATPTRSEAQVAPVVLAIAKSPVGQFVLQWVGGKVLDLVYDRVTGKLDTADLQRQLEALSRQDASRAAELYELKRQVAACATRAEVQAALDAAARRIDAQLADHAVRIRDLEVKQRQAAEEQAKLARDLGLTREDLARLTGRVDVLTRRVDDHDSRLGAQGQRLDAQGVRLDSQGRQLETHGQRLDAHGRELADLKKWSNAEQATKLALAAADMLERGGHKEAIRYLTQAHAYAPEDPGVAYVLAVAHYEDGNAKEAELWVAKGIAAERLKVPAAWFTTVLPRYQGRVRSWLDGRRYDPVLGVRSSGDVRLSAAPPAGGSPTPARR